MDRRFLIKETPVLIYALADQKTHSIDIINLNEDLGLYDS
jgi:hypothetical protein